MKNEQYLVEIKKGHQLKEGNDVFNTKGEFTPVTKTDIALWYHHSDNWNKNFLVRVPMSEIKYHHVEVPCTEVGKNPKHRLPEEGIYVVCIFNNIPRGVCSGLWDGKDWIEPTDKGDFVIKPSAWLERVPMVEPQAEGGEEKLKYFIERLDTNEWCAYSFHLSKEQAKERWTKNPSSALCFDTRNEAEIHLSKYCKNWGLKEGTGVEITEHLFITPPSVNKGIEKQEPLMFEEWILTNKEDLSDKEVKMLLNQNRELSKTRFHYRYEGYITAFNNGSKTK
jgi:hypothetical protein